MNPIAVELPDKAPSVSINNEINPAISPSEKLSVFFIIYYCLNC